MDLSCSSERLLQSYSSPTKIVARLICSSLCLAGSVHETGSRFVVLSMGRFMESTRRLLCLDDISNDFFSWR